MLHCARETTRRAPRSLSALLIVVVLVIPLQAVALFLPGSALIAPAAAASGDFTVDLGDTIAEISKVKNGTTDPDCVHYYGLYPNQATRTSGPVPASSGKWASVSYGVPAAPGYGCPGWYPDDPGTSDQTSMGFKPVANGSQDVGQVFLVGMMRHVNKPVVVSKQGPSYTGSFRVQTALIPGTMNYAINADFPWIETDTPNACSARIDANGKMIVGQNGAASKGTTTAGVQLTEYAWPTSAGASGGARPVRVPQGTVASWDELTYYDAQGQPLTTIYDGYYVYWAFESQRSNQGNRDIDGRQCSDDFLSIQSTRSTDVWTAPNGIKYQLKLWGFTNAGTSPTCQPTAAEGNLSQFFITEETLTSYGCLYGSLEQVRPITFSKVAFADPSAQVAGKAGVNPPTFSFTNASTPGSYGADVWGAIDSLTPSSWGASGKATSDSNRYELLAPNDRAAVQENLVSPQASFGADGLPLTSGWHLKGVTCTYGEEGKRLELSAAVGGGYLDEKQFNPATRTINLDQSAVARVLQDTDIECTWNNEYVIGAGTLTLVNIVDSGTAASTDWTLTATPKTADLSGQKTLSGVSGGPEVTGVRTGGGTYTLGTANGPEDYIQNGSWACVKADGSSVNVDADGNVVLGEGENLTCTVHHKTSTTPVAATKALAGATDGAKKDTYRLEYTCSGGISSTPVAGTVDLPKDGTAQNIGVDANGASRLKIGASCELREAPLDQSGLATSERGSFTWEAPAFAVTQAKNGGAPTTLTTTALAAKDGKGPGVSFTVPDSADGNVTVRVTNSVSPHAGVLKTFNSVVKSSTPVGGRDTFDQTYTVTVTNPSTTAPLTYDLSDTVAVPSGTSVNSISVSGVDNAGAALTSPSVSSPTWTVASLALAPGATHTYTAIVNISAPDAGLPGVAANEVCDPTNTTVSAKAVVNTASVTTAGDSAPATANACGSIPKNPKFAASKTAGEVVRNTDGTFTASYQVKVENVSGASSTIIEDVTDQPLFPAGARISSITVSEGGTVKKTLNDPAQIAQAVASGIVIAEKGSGSELAARPAGQASGGGTRTILVALVFSIDPSDTGYSASSYQCAAGEEKGLRNRAAMPGDQSAGDDEACLSVDSALKFAKTVKTEPTTGSTFDIVYTVSVVNEGALPGATGVVTDKPGFAAGLIINSVKVAQGAAAAAVVAPSDGVYRLSEGAVVKSGEALTWTVTVNVSIDPGMNGYSEDALACSIDASGLLTPGHGLFNQVVTETGKDSDTTPNHDRACANVNPDAGKRGFTLVKTGSQGNLDGAAFDLYATDPSVSGAVAVSNAIASQGEKGVFNVVPLAINREYWIVETKAPDGHQLLANPVHFKVTAAGIEVLNSDTLGVSTATASASAGQTVVDTLTIKDIEAARLPLSGGTGVIPQILAALVLFGTAAWLYVAPRRRRAVGEGVR